MFSSFVRRQLLLPLTLLCVSVCFAGQGNHSTPVAAKQKRTPAKLAKTTMEGISTIPHLLRRIKPHLGPVSVGTRNSANSGLAVFPLYYPYSYATWSHSSYASLWNWSDWGPACCAYPIYPESGVQRHGDEVQVKLRVHPGTAEVLVNDSYAGTVAGLKGSLWLKPGDYELSIKAPGRAEFHRRIHVLSGKQLKITTRLAPANGAQNGKAKP